MKLKTARYMEPFMIEMSATRVIIINTNNPFFVIRYSPIKDLQTQCYGLRSGHALLSLLYFICH